MRSLPEAVKLLPALAIAAILSAGCGGDRVAGGTGTSTGNTITARVLNPDGNPAAETRVVLRPMGYVPDSIGISESSGPGSRLETTTDADGNFTFDMPAAGNYLIECFREIPKAHLVSWTENVLLAKDQSRDLGPLQLDTAAALVGTTTVTDTVGTGNLWAGFPGTERFFRLDQNLTFVLFGFPRDRKAFTLYRKRPAGDWQQITVGGWKFKPDSLPDDDIGPLPPVLVPFALPSLASKDTAINLSDSTAKPDTAKRDTTKIPGMPDTTQAIGFCAENWPDTLVQNRAMTPSPQNLRLRTVLPGAAPQLIELDPCKGSWKNVQALPTDFIQPYSAFASQWSDFVLQPDFKTYSRNTLSGNSNGSSNHSGSFAGLTGAVSHQGKFHVLYGGNEVGVFADTSFLHGGAAQERLPLQGAPSSLSGIAYLGGIMYSYAPGTPQTRLFRFDHATGASRYEAIKGPDSASTVAAIAKASDSYLWVLTDENRLLLWDARTASVAKTYIITAPARVRTMSRYPD